MSRTAIACATIGSLGLVISAAVLSAGPLDPPAGPVAPSYKTLTEVEPRTAINSVTTPGDSNSVFKITQPGSYYLTGNITGVSGKAGIEIAVNGVTIDLAGFEVVGVAGSLSGIRVDGTLATQGQVTVRNGTVRGWGESGISLNGVTLAPVLIKQVAANYNGLLGMQLGGGAVVSECLAQGNATWGIACGTRSLVERCTASANGTGSAPGGGISVLLGSEVRDCVAVFNGAGTGGGSGIVTDSSGTVSGCSAINNGKGTAGGSGIVTSNSSLIENCTANNNGVTGGSGGFGIATGSGSQVASCVVEINVGDGIRCGFQCMIRNNECISNSTATADGANIRLTGARNRVDENHCDGAIRGIRADTSANIIVRNTCGANSTNFDLVAGNDVGPIGTAATATSPWANIQY